MNKLIVAILWCVWMFSAPILRGQGIIFMNEGEMSVDGGTQIFVEGGIAFKTAEVKVRLDGEIAVTGDFVNNVERGQVFTPASVGVVTFTGIDKQHITGTAQKDTNYIAFPNVTITKTASFVELDSHMGADANLLQLTSGKLVLKSTQEISTYPFLYNDYSTDVMAHLRVNSVTYNRTATGQKGVVEVERQLSNAPDRQNKMFGFSSPYKEVYQDYFITNYLAQPSDIGLWGDIESSIIRPDQKMVAGRGYIAGQKNLPADRYTIDPKWGSSVALHNDQFVNKITFNRYAVDESTSSIKNVLKLADSPDMYTVEELNTGDIILNLKKGWQYIGNPFTSPLDMESFITATNNADDWKVARPSDNSSGVAPRFWVIAEGSGVLDNWTPDRFQINPTWLVHQKVGSTLQRETNDKHIVAPMQMMAIYANVAGTMTIPASQKTHKHKSSPQTISDEMLLEVADVDARSFDRLVLVFRAGASLAASDNYDVSKMVDSVAAPGQIFTQSSEGYAMITNVVPTTVKSLEMGLIPALSAQNKTLTAHRIASLTAAVSQVWLEDRVAGGAWVNLKTTTGYTFESKPTDRIDRFVIHINVVSNGQSVPAKAIPANLFKSTLLPGISSIAVSSTGPVGSKLTDAQFEITADLVCEGSPASVKVDSSLTKVAYTVLDAPKNGSSKGGPLAGTGDAIEIKPVTVAQSGTYYVSAMSTDGLITVNRPRPVLLEFIKSMIYPDVRVTVCANTNQTIHLSKYLDTTHFESVLWEKSYGPGSLVGDKLQLTSSDSGTQSLRYTVTDVCKTAAPARFYLTTRAHRKLVDTIVVCYETAEALQLNQIFGLEAGGTITPELSSLAPKYFNVSKTPQVFAGAATFSGKAAYLENSLLPAAPAKYGVGAKAAVFKYTPATGSCFTEAEYKLVIILTQSIL